MHTFAILGELNFWEQVKRSMTKILKRSKLLGSVIRWSTPREVVILVIASPRINTRTIQNIVYYLERKYFVYLVLLHPRSWISFLMYLYPYRQVSIVPGFFLFNKKYLVTDKPFFRKAIRLNRMDHFVSGQTAVPYFKHPSFCWPKDQPGVSVVQSRLGWVFFAGNVNPDLYDRAGFETKYRIPNRYAVYQYIRQRTDVLEDVFFDVKNENHRNRLFIHTLQRSSLEGERYPQYLSAFRFMICAPGVSMPLCHNVVEAMAYGCIPIFSYPEWLPDGLEHRRNCMIFRSLSELTEVLDEIRHYDDQKCQQLRNALLTYYKKEFVDFRPDLQHGSVMHILNEEKTMI